MAFWITPVFAFPFQNFRITNAQFSPLCIPLILRLRVAFTFLLVLLFPVSRMPFTHFSYSLFPVRNVIPSDPLSICPVILLTLTLNLFVVRYVPSLFPLTTFCNVFRTIGRVLTFYFVAMVCIIFVSAFYMFLISFGVFCVIHP